MPPTPPATSTPTSVPAVSRSWWLRYGKRPVDVIVAGLGLLVLSPLLLLVAAAIKLTSPGPVFFTQERGGKDGRLFRVIKFRTMRGDRKPDPKELVPLHHPEITLLGRWLRRSKIDEIPQLINVVRGEMSLVGPRPTLPDQVAAYDAFRRQRLLVRPGVTGLAQVNSSASRPWDERILYDIAYVRRCSLGLDLAVLLRSVAVVIVGEERMVRDFFNSLYGKYVDPPEGYGVQRERRKP